MDKQPQKEFITINEYLDTLNKGLEKYEKRVIGEIIDITPYPDRSYLFFKLKDKNEETPAILTCMMWKNAYRISGVKLEIGLEIIISGTSNVHKPTGRFTFIPKTLELVGEGALKIAYEKLKEKLQKEGLFDEAKKETHSFIPK